LTEASPAPAQVHLPLEITIRPAVQEDLPRLEMEGIFLRFRRIFHKAYHEMLRGDRLMLVAACEDALVGRLFILYRSSDNQIADGKNRAYLYSFYVLPAFRGKGLGTHMVRYAESLLIEKGFKSVTIAVAKDNDGAFRLYSRLNYHIMREDKGRWSYTDHRGKTHHMNEPCWIMQKHF